MELRYLVADPTGNITLLVETPVRRQEQPALALRLMEREPSAEQVGFLEKAENGAHLHLQMAGGEFCGNASLSAAAVFAQREKCTRVRLSVSGAEAPVSVSLKPVGENRYEGEVSLPLPRCGFLPGKDRLLPFAAFPGMTHVLCEEKLSREQAEAFIKVLADRFPGQAVGLMLLDRSGGRLTPLVYVPKAHTLFWESSCASGTAAVGACLARECGGLYSARFDQPGGALGVKAQTENGVLRSLTLHGKVSLSTEKCVTLE